MPLIQNTNSPYKAIQIQLEKFKNSKQYAQKLSSKSKFSPMDALVCSVSIQQSLCLVGQLRSRKPECPGNVKHSYSVCLCMQFSPLSNFLALYL